MSARDRPQYPPEATGYPPGHPGEGRTTALWGGPASPGWPGWLLVATGGYLVGPGVLLAASGRYHWPTGTAHGHAYRPQPPQAGGLGWLWP